MNGKIHIVCPSCHTVNRLLLERLNDKPSCGKCHTTLFCGAPLELTTTTFQTHIQRNDIPVIVDFWAPWCGPCKTMAPMFTQATSQLEPLARLAKINTEAEQTVGAQFNIRSIPTLVAFKKGREVTRKTGGMGAAEIISWVQSLLD